MLHVISGDIYVAVEKNQPVHPLVSTAELASCQGNFNRLEELLQVKMQALQNVQTPDIRSKWRTSCP